MAKVLSSTAQSLNIVFIFFSAIAMAQHCEISGYVRDVNNKPLPAVNVLLKGTPIGTVTNLEGHFRIQIPSGQNILLFSFTGYKMFEQPVNVANAHRYQLNVVLARDRRKNRKQKSSGELISSQP